jgi:hypothetical protein
MTRRAEMQADLPPVSRRRELLFLAGPHTDYWDYRLYRWTSLRKWFGVRKKRKPAKVRPPWKR